MVETQAFTIDGPRHTKLAARLETPSETPITFALFVHCFSCGKNSSASVLVSRALATLGIATLRFDFAGIGQSEGDFSRTDFSSNLADIVAAAEFLRTHFMAPSLLVGHSLGGAAVLAAAERISEVKAVATIGAPFDVAHIEHNFKGAVAAIESHGQADVVLGRQMFTLRRGFLEDVRMQPQKRRIRDLGRALLVLHSPIDAVVGIENAAEIFASAKHPKSFVSLDKADHFLTASASASYAASLIAAWARNYLPAQVQ